jgi:hypothetical protein
MFLFHRGVRGAVTGFDERRHCDEIDGPRQGAAHAAKPMHRTLS